MLMSVRFNQSSGQSLSTSLFSSALLGSSHRTVFHAPYPLTSPAIKVDMRLLLLFLAQKAWLAIYKVRNQGGIREVVQFVACLCRRTKDSVPLPCLKTQGHELFYPDALPVGILLETTVVKVLLDGLGPDDEDIFAEAFEGFLQVELYAAHGPFHLLFDANDVELPKAFVQVLGKAFHLIVYGDALLEGGDAAVEKLFVPNDAEPEVAGADVNA